MAYRLYTWRLGDSTEYEIKYAGRYGAKGEKRQPRRKTTPAQVAEQNQRNKVNWVRRLIKVNFEPGDKWVTLKYPAGARPPLCQIKKDMRNFLSRLRRSYKGMGEELKYIYRLEVGKHGGVHIHIIINKSQGRPDTDCLIQEKWTAGRIYYANLYEIGGYEQLAEYIAKKNNDVVENQLSFFPEEDRKFFRTYNTSRNLIHPEPEIKIYKRRTLRKLIKDGPTASEGYYIDKNSIEYGTNDNTGISYYRYTEIRIKRTSCRKGGRAGG